MAKFLQDLMYTNTHEWVKIEGDKAKIGLTDYAQHHLGDIVFVNIPVVGDDVTAGEPCCDVESVKAVSDVFCPVSGVISAVNEELEDNPALINEDCYAAWICEIENVSGTENLLDPAAYAALLEKAEAEEEAH